MAFVCVFAVMPYECIFVEMCKHMFESCAFHARKMMRKKFSKMFSIFINNNCCCYNGYMDREHSQFFLTIPEQWAFQLNLCAKKNCDLDFYENKRMLLLFIHVFQYSLASLIEWTNNNSYTAIRSEHMHKNNIGCNRTRLTKKIHSARTNSIDAEKIFFPERKKSEERKKYSKYLCWNWNNSVLIFTSVSSLNLVCFIFTTYTSNKMMMILPTRKIVGFVFFPFVRGCASCISISWY